MPRNVVVAHPGESTTSYFNAAFTVERSGAIVVVQADGECAAFAPGQWLSAMGPSAYTTALPIVTEPEQPAPSVVEAPAPPPVPPISKRPKTLAPLQQLPALKLGECHMYEGTDSIVVGSLIKTAKRVHGGNYTSRTLDYERGIVGVWRVS